MEINNSEKLLQMIGGKWVTAALSAAADIGLPDTLCDAPASAVDLAERLDCEPHALERLLRVLVTQGIVHISPHDIYSLTPLGELLKADAFGPLATYVGTPEQWAPWSRLSDTVRTGTSAFELWHGEPLFPFLDARPEHAERYHAGVDAFTRRQARALAQIVDFTHRTHVADVGGGWGTLLVELLDAWPHLRGTLFDRPPIVTQAKATLADNAAIDRIQFVGGSFFEEIPGGVDAIVLKHVLHNWDDEGAGKILRNCINALTDDGLLIVIEGIVLPGNRPDPTRLLDLEMLALCDGGVERSKPEFRHLFHTEGLKLARTVPLLGGTRALIVERR